MHDLWTRASTARGRGDESEAKRLTLAAIQADEREKKQDALEHRVATLEKRINGLLESK